MKNEQTKPFWRVFTAGAAVLLTLLGGWKAIGMPASEIPTNTFSAASLQVVIRGELTAAAHESLVMAQLKEGLYALLFFEFCVLFAAAVLSVWAAMRKTLQKRMLRQMHALAALALFYLQIGRSYAKAYCVGLLLFLVLLGWAMARRTQRDLNDRYQLETYKKLAYLDALTGLSNYAAFKNHQQQWETRQDWGYIMLDVNGLKEANDTFGHAAGDELIQGAARCIQEAFYHADGCYRVGGDEFAVVWSGVDEAVVRRAVDRFRNLCREQNTHAEYPVSVAVGYALQKDRTLTSDELLHEADARMYRNKARIKAVLKKTPR